ncbi:MAG: MFS transporter [Actinomycetota bacterium]
MTTPATDDSRADVGAAATAEPVGERSTVDSAAGWIVVAATFVSTFTVFGVAYSFGAFFVPMADEFDSPRSAIALFFSITTFLYFGLGVVTGRISDRIGPRPVLLFGAACLVAGLLATSQVDSLVVGYLTYGIGVGIGVACAYVPMVATVGLWFERRRTAALGVSVAGIGVGTLVVVPVAEALIERQGWRDTYLLLAAGAAVLLGLAAIGARRPDDGRAAAEVVPLAQVIRGSRAFALLYASSMSLVVALFLPFVFLGDYLDEQGIDGSAALLVGTIGLASVIGRLALGALAARVAAIRLYQGSFLVVALSFLIWVSAGTSYPVLVFFAVVLGVAYGGFIALAPAVAADLFGPVGLGGVLGALYTAAGLGGLVGPPLAGELIDRSGYTPALLTAFGFALVGFLILIPLRPDRTR